MQRKELLGLIGSVVVQKMPGMLPAVVLETDKTIAIEHPFPDTAIHYVVLPKKDIKNAGEISSENTAYLVDAYAVMSRLIREKNLRSYRITTNGPGLQDVAYLHFHVRSKAP